MKQNLISAFGGAVIMLFFLLLISNRQAHDEGMTEYCHIDYVSSITESECYICCENGKNEASSYWGEDNVGIIDLNNFNLLYLGINPEKDTYHDPSGILLSCGIMNQDSGSYVHANVLPNRAYATLQLTGIKYSIERDFIQSMLCQKCLDSINTLWYTTQPPAEYAIISFQDRTIQPLVNSIPWFSAGNFGVDCEFKIDGSIDLLIHYCPPRYS